MFESVNRFAWIESHDVALTVAVVTGGEESAVIRGYGGRPEERMELTLAEAERMAARDGGGVVCVLGAAGQVVAVESNGWSGSIPELARRLSAPPATGFFSVSWSVEATFRILAATAGVVTEWFDPLYGGAAAGPADLVPPWAAGAGFVPGRLRAACLAAVADRTGVDFAAEWLQAPLPAYRIPDPELLLAGVPGAWLP